MKRNGGKAHILHFVYGGAAEDVLARLKTTNRKILQFLPPLPSVSPSFAMTRGNAKAKQKI